MRLHLALKIAVAIRFHQRHKLAVVHLVALAAIAQRQGQRQRFWQRYAFRIAQVAIWFWIALGVAHNGGAGVALAQGGKQSLLHGGFQFYACLFAGFLQVCLKVSPVHVQLARIKEAEQFPQALLYCLPGLHVLFYGFFVFAFFALHQ